MSKMRRLKREKIKVTISGLALMMAIGTVGGIGSYAYFIDKAEADNSLKVTMGTFDIVTRNKYDMELNISNLSEQKMSKPMTITNEGSLDQNIDISFNFENNKNLYQIPCKLTFENGAKLKDKTVENLGQLSNIKNISIVNPDGKSLYTLKAGESINCTLEIDIRGVEDKQSIKGDIKFSTDVNARQINMPKEVVTNENIQ